MSSYSLGHFSPWSLFNDTFDIAYAPRTPVRDWTEEDGKYTTSIPLAGCNKSNVSVTAQDGTLRISAKTSRKVLTKTIPLPDNADPTSLTAKMEDGMLTITASLIRPTTIEVPIE